MPGCDSGVSVSSCALLIRGILAAVRQKIHLSRCPNSPNHLSVSSHRQWVQGLLRRSAPAPASQRSAPLDPGSSAHAKRTALRFNRTLGSAEVVHPFHPLRGQRFLVLKVRTVSGLETLSLRDADRGS